MTDEEALAVLAAEVAALLRDSDVEVDAERVEGGGWKAKLRRPPGSEPIIGLGSLFLRPDGRLISYPSSYSPRMALEAFQAEVKGGSL